MNLKVELIWESLDKYKLKLISSWLISETRSFFFFIWADSSFPNYQIKPKNFLKKNSVDRKVISQEFFSFRQNDPA